MTGPVAGIDPGLDGAVAILKPDGELVVRITPTLVAGKGHKRIFDLPAMIDLFMVADGTFPDLVVLEQVSARPAQGVTSCFSFGAGYGMWQGILAALRIPYQLVTPQKWKGAVLAGTDKGKQAAVAMAGRRFPGIDLTASARSRVPHDGKAEASLMALYARHLLNGKQDDAA